LPSCQIKLGIRMTHGVRSGDHRLLAYHGCYGLDWTDMAAVHQCNMALPALLPTRNPAGTGTETETPLSKIAGRNKLKITGNETCPERLSPPALPHLVLRMQEHHERHPTEKGQQGSPCCDADVLGLVRMSSRMCCCCMQAGAQSSARHGMLRGLRHWTTAWHLSL
jgi:hypothetical protein